MAKYSFFMLSLLMASAVATRRQDEEAEANKLSASMQRNYQTTSISSYWRESALQNTEDSPSCKVVVAKTPTFNTTNVYICEKESAYGICYFSALKKCCPNSVGEPQDIIYVGHHEVPVSLYEAEQGFCVFFHENNTEIELCKSNSQCFPPSCADIKPAFCADQCISTRTVSQCQTCQPEYQEPSCCECKHPFVKNFLGQCGCPPGQVNVNGSCRSACTSVCGPKSCFCEIGYAPPDCCNCLFERPNNLFVRLHSGRCRRICTENTFKGNAVNCYSTSGCSECKNGFRPPDCCGCLWPKVLVGDVCIDCPSGQTNIRGRCEEHCGDNQISFYGRCSPCPPYQKPDRYKRRCICNSGARPDYRGLCPVTSANIEKDLIDAVQELLGRLD